MAGHTRQSLVAGLALLVVLLVAGACGGDDETASTTVSPTTTTEAATTTVVASTAPTTSAVVAPTRAEFIAAGDAICASTHERFADIEFGADATLDELTTLITDRMLPAMQAELDELKALELPAERSAEATAVFAAFADGIVAIEAEPMSLLTGASLDQASQLAAEFGFEACGVSAMPQGPPATTGGGDFTVEQAMVAAVVEEFYLGATTLERGLELLQDAERLEGVLAETMTNPVAQTFSTVVTDVVFPDDTACAEGELGSGCALVTHDFLVGELVVSEGTTTYAVVEEGEWKVAAVSFCETSARAGTPCA